MTSLTLDIFFIIAACIVYPVFGIVNYLISRNLSDSGKLRMFLFIPIIIGFFFGVSLLMVAINSLPE